MDAKLGLYQLRVKRLGDFFISAMFLTALSPLIFIIAVAVRVRLGSPVLFRQLRPGKDGVPFELVKFRTMSDGRSPEGTGLDDAERLNSFGRWLRTTSLDELPELFNVLRGQMSLVGPRPLLMEYLAQYSTVQARRHEVRPGITGWAQINGRNALSWKEKFELDVWYVENVNLQLDLKILMRTVSTVISRSGIHSEGQATVAPFRNQDPLI
jgi:sugar transferase EpsL